MSLTLPIVIGRKYVRRDGTVVTARAAFPGFIRGCLYVGDSDKAVSRNSEHAWAHTGKISGSHANNPCDLISDHVETAGHPHAALMLEYAQDAMKTAEPWKLWQHSDMQTGWFDCEEHPKWGTVMEYRRKPRTIRIGEFDVPEPLRDAPAVGDAVYAVATEREQLFASMPWDPFDLWCPTNLQRRVLHLTREAAEQHARALLSFTEQK